jgi:hypothetical protein
MQADLKSFMRENCDKLALRSIPLKEISILIN